MNCKNFVRTVCALALILSTGMSELSAQKYFTRDGKITFSSDAPMEKIEGVNRKATSVIDVESGAMEFAILIKSFHFEKALMEEHFNENYMESGKYPKAMFKGKVTNMDEVDLSVDGEYSANITGDLTIRGKTKPIETTGIFTVFNGMVKGTSTFSVTVADYDIDIPNVVKDNIAKHVEIDVEVDYKPLAQ